MKRLSLLCLFLALLGSGAWAQPAIAIVRVVKGEVSLNEVPLQKARLAREGDVLGIGNYGQARVQLIGSGKEVTFDKFGTHVLKKQQLELQARPVSRSTPEAADGTGSLARVAGHVTRRSTQTGIHVHLPPERLRDGRHAVRVEVSASEAEKWTRPVRVIMGDNRDLSLFDCLYSFQLHPEIELYPVPSVLAEPDRSFQVSIVVGQELGSEQVWRYRNLSPATADALERESQRLRSEAERSGALEPLLDLADLYLSFDQLQSAHAVLTQIKNGPHYDRFNATDRASFDKTITTLESVLGLEPDSK